MLVPQLHRQPAEVPQLPHPLLLVLPPLLVCWGQHGGNPGADHQVWLELYWDAVLISLNSGFCWRGLSWTDPTPGASSSPSSNWSRTRPSSSGPTSSSTAPRRSRSCSSLWPGAAWWPASPGRSWSSSSSPPSRQRSERLETTWWRSSENSGHWTELFYVIPVSSSVISI